MITTLVKKAWAIYEVLWEGPLGAQPPEPPALAVCSTKNEALALQSDKVLTSLPTVIKEVDVLVHRDALGEYYHILADTEGFTPGTLKMKRLGLAYQRGTSGFGHRTLLLGDE